MNVYGDFVYASGTNNPLPNVPVSVMIANTQTLAPLFNSVGASINNPVNTDQTGYFEFYAAAGVYDIYAVGKKYYEISLAGNVAVPDPLTINNLTVNQQTTLGLTDITATSPATDTLYSSLHVNTTDQTTGTTSTNQSRGIFNELFSAVVKAGSATVTAITNITTLQSGFAKAAGAVSACVNAVVGDSGSSANNIISGNNLITISAGATANTTTACGATITNLGSTTGQSIALRGAVVVQTGATADTIFGSLVSPTVTGTANGVYGYENYVTINAAAAVQSVNGFVSVAILKNTTVIPYYNGVSIGIDSAQIGTFTTGYGFTCGDHKEAVAAGGSFHAFYSNVIKAAGKNIWAFYAGGDAPSYFGGTVLVGTTTDDGVNKLQISGTQRITTAGFTPPITLTALALRIVGSNTSTTAIGNHSFIDGAGLGARLVLTKNTAAGGYPVSTAQLGVIQFGTFDSTQAMVTGASIQCNAEENFTDASRATSLRFATTPVGSTTTAERMRITPYGSLLLNQTTGFSDTAVPTFQMTGGMIVKASNAAYPYANLNSGANIFAIGANSGGSSFEGICLSDSFAQAPAMKCARTRVNGALPQTGDLLGSFMAGTITPSNSVYAVHASVTAYAESNATEAPAGTVNMASSLRFLTSPSTGLNTERMRVTALGEVLIATTTPFSLGVNDMLHVNGGAYINGTVTCDTVEAGTVNAASGTLTDMRFTNVPIFANNAAAVTGGLVAGYLYRTGADPDHLCIVH